MIDINWYIKRIKLMSIPELFLYRVPQMMQFQVWGKLHVKQKKSNSELLKNPKFQIADYNIENIPRGVFATNSPFLLNVFGHSVNIGERINWRKDHVNNIASDLGYYANFDKQDFNKNGDIKVVSEISRFYFGPFLAIQKCVGDEERSLYQILLDWEFDNPYLKSINWTSGIEVAIRIVNLLYAYLILKNNRQLTEKEEIIFIRYFKTHYHYLKHHLSLYSSANNHLMAELMGLVCLSSVFQMEEKETKKWRRMFFEQILTQVNEDGVNMELSSRYHAEVCDQILIGVEFLKSINYEVPKNVLKRFEKMFEFTEHLVYRNNETNFGDNDEGAVIFPYNDKNFNLYQSQLVSGNILGFKIYSEHSFDFRNYILFGKVEELKNSTHIIKNKYFDKSGYVFMYDHKHHSKLSIDVGAIGDAISAAHGHSDLLHFNFEYQGVPFFVDCGTYQYHSKELKWRNYFRGVSAHNTVSINKKNHALANNRMSWLGDPKVTVSNLVLEGDFLECEASHNAYNDVGVIHKRKWKWNIAQNELSVFDSCLNFKKNQNVITAYYNLHPDVKVMEIERGVKLIRSDVEMDVIFEGKGTLSYYRGKESTPLGWYSANYGIKTPSNCLVYEMESNDDENFAIKIKCL